MRGNGSDRLSCPLETAGSLLPVPLGVLYSTYSIGVHFTPFTFENILGQARSLPPLFYEQVWEVVGVGGSRKLSQLRCFDRSQNVLILSCVCPCQEPFQDFFRGVDLDVTPKG